jgi:hypothetical protein
MSKKLDSEKVFLIRPAQTAQDQKQFGSLDTWTLDTGEEYL